ncbi:MAG: AtpZ/AtpI family protein, partial [Terriglobales bacterium]
PRTKNQEPRTKNQEPMTNNQQPLPDDQPPKKAFYVQLAEYSQLAIVLPACTVVGWLIGVGLDTWLHTKWLYIVGLLVGIAAGFVELVRTAMKPDRNG